MMRAALYARYSTDLQDPRSIEDQLALCRDFAKREGLTIVSEFSDHARSGASVIGRDGLMALMEAARDRRFDAVIVEALDRLSRDQEDLAGLYKRLTFQSIEIRAVFDGRADAVAIGVRGLLGQLYLSDLAHKVRRGLAGRVRNGLSAGGRAYGYRPKSGAPGELVIEPSEAAIVRRIHAEYAEGKSPRAIAAGLNREGVAAPRGKFWSASTINGSRSRGYGILGNALYRGAIVWNKVRMLKDPETGKRISRPNPPEAWQHAEAPQLAIVDTNTFAIVQARRGEAPMRKPWTARSPRRLLSGLLKCGACGGGMAVHDRDSTGKTRVRCTRGREAGACGHDRLYYLEAIEQIVIEGLRANLADPRLIAEYVKAYGEERRRLAAGAVAGRAKRERRLAEVSRQIERAIDAICEGTARKEEIGERLARLGAEKEALSAELAAAPPAQNVVALHPEAVRRYLAQVEALSAAIAGPGKPRSAGAIDPAGAAALRELVEKVIVHPVPPRTALDIEITGYLGSLIEAPALPPSGRYRGVLLVAEARARQYPTNERPGRWGLRLTG